MKSRKYELLTIGILLSLIIVVGALIYNKLTEEEVIAAGGFELELSLTARTPLGVAVSENEDVYVSDTGNARLAVYDGHGKLLHLLDAVDDNGSPLPFSSPYGIAIDDSRNKVYICDFAVRVIDKDGNFLYNLIPPEEVIAQVPGEASPRPNQVALYQDKVYVTSKDGIYIFNAEDGSFINKWGTRGKQIGQYDYPNGITINPENGDLFIVDTNNWRIVALTNDGRIRWVLGNLYDEKIPSPFHLPRSIAFGPDGLLYISDIPDRIVVLDQDGNLQWFIGERGTALGKLNFPEGLAFSPSDNLFVADRENNRVQSFRLMQDLPLPTPGEAKKFQQALKVYITAGKSLP